MILNPGLLRDREPDVCPDPPSHGGEAIFHCRDGAPARHCSAISQAMSGVIHEAQMMATMVTGAAVALAGGA